MQTKLQENAPVVVSARCILRSRRRAPHLSPHRLEPHARRRQTNLVRYRMSSFVHRSCRCSPRFARKIKYRYTIGNTRFSIIATQRDLIHKPNRKDALLPRHCRSRQMSRVGIALSIYRQSSRTPSRGISLCNASPTNMKPVPVGFTARTALKSIRQTGTIEEYNASFSEVVSLIPDMAEADKVDKYIEGTQARTSPQGRRYVNPNTARVHDGSRTARSRMGDSEEIIARIITAVLPY